MRVQAPRRSYSEILADLAPFEEYVGSLKLPEASHRLRQIIAKIGEIEDARLRGSVDALYKRPDLPELVWSLVEGQEFIEIFRGLRGYDSAIMRDLLEKALRGPMNPARETNASNIGRNTAFELRLGSGLRRAGGTVTLGGDADVILDYAGARIYFECKRPFYQHNVPANTEKALSQLQRRLDAEKRTAVGFVAVSVSKALNPGTNLYSVESYDALQGLSSETMRIHAQNRLSKERVADVRICGIIYHIFTPALVKNEGLFVASQWDLFPDNVNLTAMLPIGGESLKAFLGRAL